MSLLARAFGPPPLRGHIPQDEIQMEKPYFCSSQCFSIFNSFIKQNLKYLSIEITKKSLYFRRDVIPTLEIFYYFYMIWIDRNVFLWHSFKIGLYRNKLQKKYPSKNSIIAGQICQF